MHSWVSMATTENLSQDHSKLLFGSSKLRKPIAVNVTGDDAVIPTTPAALLSPKHADIIRSPKRATGSSSGSSSLVDSQRQSTATRATLTSTTGTDSSERTSSILDKSALYDNKNNSNSIDNTLQNLLFAGIVKQPAVKTRKNAQKNSAKQTQLVDDAPERTCSAADGASRAATVTDRTAPATKTAENERQTQAHQQLKDPAHSLPEYDWLR